MLAAVLACVATVTAPAPTSTWLPPASSTHVFVHVPKNGGGTADVYFRGCAEVHVAFATHTLRIAQVLRAGRVAVAVLRDPADRVISEHQWGRLNFGKDYDDGHKREHLRPGNDTAPPQRWDESHADRLLHRTRRVLKPQHEFFFGVPPDHPRVRVLCMERLSAGLVRLAAEACTRSRGSDPSSKVTDVPRLHRTQSADEAEASSSHYTMSDGLRRKLRAAYPNDTQIYQKYCTAGGQVPT